MKKLNLSGNELDDETADVLSTCLFNIEVLNIGNCLMTKRGLEKICEAIRKASVVSQHPRKIIL